MQSKRSTFRWSYVLSLVLAVVWLPGLALATPAAAPTLNPIADMFTLPGGSCHDDQTISGSDPDGDPLTFEKVAGPSFMTVTTTSPTTGNIHLQAGFSDAGSYGATVSASDGTSSDTKSFTINVFSVNRAPVLNQPANMAVAEGSTANQTLTATDPDGCPLTFFKVSGPTFMVVTTLTATSGNVHLAPGFNDGGSYTASVAASDGSVTDTKSFSILVTQECLIFLNQPVNMTVVPGATADQTVTATVSEGSVTLTASGPAFMTFTQTSPTTGLIHLAPTFSDVGTYTATIFASASCGATTSKSFMITVTSNRAPTLAQPADMTVDEGVAADQILSATDPEGGAVVFSKVAGPLFMFVTTLTATTGNIHLAPGFSDAGTYLATVRATDPLGLFDQKVLSILVLQVCHPPIALAGGPYFGVINIPVQFDGTGSSDPSGAPLTYAWDFGDGSTATGPTPQHVYTAFGIYTVTLTVVGECGSDTDVTTATIGQSCTQAFTRGGNKTLRLNSGRPTFCVQLEPIGGCYDNSAVILSSIVMRYGGSEIHATAGKTTLAGDTNGNGIEEISACFSKTDLRTLFAGLPPGENTITVTIAGNLISGAPILAELSIRVFATGGAALTASVWPNPMNPSATLTFVTTQPGFARVRLYDLGGRMVRALLNEENLGAGPHSVHIDGRGGNGAPLASGIYYFQVEAAEGTEQGRFTLLK